MKQKWIAIRADIMGVNLDDRENWTDAQKDAWNQYLRMGVPESSLIQAVNDRNNYYSIRGVFNIVRKSYNKAVLTPMEQEVLNDWRENGDSRGLGWNCYWTGVEIKWRNDGRAPGGDCSLDYSHQNSSVMRYVRRARQAA